MALFATSDQTFVIILILYCFCVCCFSGSVCPFSPCYIFFAEMLLSLESSIKPCWNDVAEFVPLTNVSALGRADQQGGTGVHDRGVQTPAPAWLHRGREVIVENHRATAGEHDPSVRVHGAHALSGRGEPRTLPGFAYATGSGFGRVFPKKSPLQQGCATLSVRATTWMIPVGVIFTDFGRAAVLCFCCWFSSPRLGKLTIVGQVRRGKRLLPKSDWSELLMF